MRFINFLRQGPDYARDILESAEKTNFFRLFRIGLNSRKWKCLSNRKTGIIYIPRRESDISENCRKIARCSSYRTLRRSLNQSELHLRDMLIGRTLIWSSIKWTT